MFLSYLYHPGLWWVRCVFSLYSYFSDALRGATWSEQNADEIRKFSVCNYLLALELVKSTSFYQTALCQVSRGGLMRRKSCALFCLVLACPVASCLMFLADPVLSCLACLILPCLVLWLPCDCFVLWLWYLDSLLSRLLFGFGLCFLVLLGLWSWRLSCSFFFGLWSRSLVLVFGLGLGLWYVQLFVGHYGKSDKRKNNSPPSLQVHTVL